MSVLDLHGIGVVYGDTAAVTSFSASVDTGSWLCLIGPNGAGKSSILRAVAGLVRHTGTITVDGVDAAAMERRRRAACVAYVPQSPQLPDDMHLYEYVLLGRNPYVGYFGRESHHDRGVADAVIDRLDLGRFARRLLGELSGGERQRVVVARALAQQSPVLLLDEATSALDIGHQQRTLELVDELRRERHLTVVSAMHDLTLAGLYAGRLALLHQGHTVASGPPASVLRAETLSEFYGASVSVQTDASGTVVVVPHRTR